MEIEFRLTLAAYPSCGERGIPLVAEISAASILAKVARDQEMEELDKKHPEYAFAQHKGYPTKLHLEKLAELGPLPEYRRSFFTREESIRHRRIVRVKGRKIKG